MEGRKEHSVHRISSDVYSEHTHTSCTLHSQNQSISRPPTHGKTFLDSPDGAADVFGKWSVCPPPPPTPSRGFRLFHVARTSDLRG